MDQTLIKIQLTKILSSSYFKRSKILSDFLNYIVLKTLDGKEKYLKEYIIATMVLNKKSDFDSQLDAIVRVHATRLRKILHKYYIHEGTNDPIKIYVPKGSYIPVFETQNTNKSAHRQNLLHVNHKYASKPIIAVLPFIKFQENERLNIICSIMQQELSTELSKYDNIDVISNYSILKASENEDKLNDFLTRFCANYLITGSCFIEDKRVKVSIELNYRTNNQLIWAHSYYIDDFEATALSGYRPIIHKVIATLCGHFGLIYRNELSANQPSDYVHLYAVYCHNRYHLMFSEEAFHEALKAVEIGLEANPSNALLTAFHGEIFLNLLAMDVVGEIDFLKTGTQLANKAVQLDCNNQHAFQVLCWANILNHNSKAFFHSAIKCLEINPNNPMYSGAMGFGYVCAGKYERGFELLTASIILNPYYSLNVNVGFTLYYIYKNEYEKALDWAERIERPTLVWDAILRVSVHGLLEEIEVSEELRIELFTLSPDFSNRARIIVNTFILDMELQNKIIQGLILAGIKIPERVLS